MIIIIDSNVFIADPHCKGLAWRAFIHAAPAWGLHVATTEVVIAEVVSKYERVIDERQKELDKISRSLSQFGLDQVLSRPSAMMAAAKEAYPNVVRKILNDCDVEIVQVPDIPHMELVERATKRRRPCDDEGNGYRDTLNWLIVLRTAQANPSEQIAWVSGDTDFLAKDASALHADLIDDLASIDASDQVVWYRNIKELVLKLAAEKSIIAADDIRALADHLQKSSIARYLATDVLPAAINSPLNTYLCGLPILTKSARLLGSTDVNENVDVDLTGSISGDQVLAQFSLEATAIIEVLSEDSEVNSPSESADSQSGATISKRLFFRGIITLDPHGKPISAEISAIEASPDDPGRKELDELLARFSQLSSDYFKNLVVPSLPKDYFKNLVLPSLPPDYFKNLVVPSLPKDYFKNLVLPSLPPDFFKNLVVPSLPKDYLKNLTLASEYAEEELGEDEDGDENDGDDSREDTGPDDGPALSCE